MSPTLFSDLENADLQVDALYRGGRAGNTGDDPISRLLPVGNMGGFRYKGVAEEGAKVCVLYSHMADIDWPDRLFPELGRFVYFGDNKTPGHEIHDTPRKGNLVLRNAFDNLHSGNRVQVPPFLIFTKGESRRDVVFRGLAVPGAPGVHGTEDLVAIWKSRYGERFQNYRAVFTVLDVATVDRTWISSVCAGDPMAGAPDPWRVWVETGHYKPLLAPRTREYRTKNEQLPEDPTRWALLEQIHAYFSDHPDGWQAFEKCAVDIFRRMDPSVGDVDVTRPTGDGGRDALGSYRIGPQDGGILVDFALEAKCKDPRGVTGSGVSDTSRLISRLRHRQFGVFVTTSHVSKQAYKELVEDQHPVLVISGRDLVGALFDTDINTNEKVDAWLQALAPKLS
jgi:hypothetical protein